MVWYKQRTDQIPRLIVLSYNIGRDIQFENEVKNGRFNISASEDSFHLNIKATTKEDIGKYYCGTVFLNKIEFISGAHLILKGQIYSTCYCLLHFLLKWYILTNFSCL